MVFDQKHLLVLEEHFKDIEREMADIHFRQCLRQTWWQRLADFWAKTNLRSIRNQDTIECVEPYPSVQVKI